MNLVALRIVGHVGDGCSPPVTALYLLDDFPVASVGCVCDAARMVFVRYFTSLFVVGEIVGKDIFIVGAHIFSGDQLHQKPVFVDMFVPIRMFPVTP